MAFLRLATTFTEILRKKYEYSQSCSLVILMKHKLISTDSHLRD
jgi:hypothetical protein